MSWTHPVQDDDDFFSSLKLEDEEEVGGGGEEEEEEGALLPRHMVCATAAAAGEEEEEEGAQLPRSMVRPLLSPPAHGYPDEDGVPRPEFVLMEPKGYFLDRDNATTADCEAGPGLEGRFKVTFCTAAPPLVSYFCVHATHYSHADFVTDPRILASETDGGLVLLCIVIGKSRSDIPRACCQHFFVYDAGARGGRPGLKHLPQPGGYFGGKYQFNGASLAIVRDCNQKKQGKEHGNNPARSEGDNSGGRNSGGPTLRPRHTLRPPRSYSPTVAPVQPQTPTVLQPHSGALVLHPHSSSGALALHPHSGRGALVLKPHSGSGALALHTHIDSSTLALHPHSSSSSALVLHPHTARAEHDCSECDYVIVARDCSFGYESPSYLCVYQSRTKCWGHKTVNMPSASISAYDGHDTTKTLTIGGVVTWFDLSRNVVICDVLAETPKVRVIGLPQPINKVNDPRTVRDIAVVGGYMNCVEVHHEINNGIIEGWMAAKWSMKVNGHSKDWHMDHKVSSANISSGSSELEGGATQPNFRKIHLGLPNISLEDSNMVYFLAKTEFWDSEKPAWVVAIDLKNNAIRQAVEYNAIKTVGFSIGYGASRISKYLKVGKQGGHHGAVTGDGRPCGEDPSGVHGEHGGQPGAVMEEVHAAGDGQRQGRARAGGVARRGRKRRRS